MAHPGAFENVCAYAYTKRDRIKLCSFAQFAFLKLATPTGKNVKKMPNAHFWPSGQGTGMLNHSSAATLVLQPGGLGRRRYLPPTRQLVINVVAAYFCILHERCGVVYSVSTSLQSH
jgi:hypothetical protein